MPHLVSDAHAEHMRKELFFEIFLPLEEEWRQKRKSVLG